VAFVAAGVAALRICGRQRLPGRFYALAWSLIGLGITSGAFHATLLWVNNKLDESFENMALIVLFHSDKPSQAAALLHAVAASLGILTISAFLFCELHLIGIVLLTLVKVRSRVRTADLATKGTAGLNGAVRLAAGSALAGFACWLVDRLFCAHLLALAFNPQLHAVWHLACGVALYEAFGKSTSPCRDSSHSRPRARADRRFALHLAHRSHRRRALALPASARVAAGGRSEFAPAPAPQQGLCRPALPGTAQGQGMRPRAREAAASGRRAGGSSRRPDFEPTDHLAAQRTKTSVSSS
jgi:hypothetical protein